MAFDVDFFVIGAGSGGVRAARIAAGHGAKTLVAELDDGFAFALVPGDRELSLRSLARAADSRSAALASERDAQRLTGYQIGGISPFGSKTALPAFGVAEWLERERVALNGGARGVILELAGADLGRVEPGATGFAQGSAMTIGAGLAAAAYGLACYSPLRAAATAAAPAAVMRRLLGVSGVTPSAAPARVSDSTNAATSAR